LRRTPLFLWSIIPSSAESSSPIENCEAWSLYSGEADESEKSVEVVFHSHSHRWIHRRTSLYLALNPCSVKLARVRYQIVNNLAAHVLSHGDILRYILRDLKVQLHLVSMLLLNLKPHVYFKFSNDADQSPDLRALVWHRSWIVENIVHEPEHQQRRVQMAPLRWLVPVISVSARNSAEDVIAKSGLRISWHKRP
jgi:hypothetical protein